MYVYGGDVNMSAILLRLELSEYNTHCARAMEDKLWKYCENCYCIVTDIFNGVGYFTGWNLNLYSTVSYISIITK
jgi:hypothetical protein